MGRDISIEQTSGEKGTCRGHRLPRPLPLQSLPRIGNAARSGSTHRDTDSAAWIRGCQSPWQTWSHPGPHSSAQHQPRRSLRMCAEF